MSRRARKSEIALVVLLAPFVALITAATALYDWFLTLVLPSKILIICAVFSFAYYIFNEIKKSIRNRMLARRQKEQFLLDFRWNTNISPLEFEVCCADYLKLRGWNASTTKSSGDHGADVVAQRMGISVVIQCKKYSKPVGSRAVQEAISGRAFHNAHHAFVISNQTYTNTAQELAEKTNVRLLHFSALLYIDNLVGLPVFKERDAKFPPNQERSIRRCPGCQVRLSLPSSRAGRVKCPSCKESYYIETYVVKSY